MNTPKREMKHIATAGVLFAATLSIYGMLYHLMGEKTSEAADLILRRESAGAEDERIRELAKSLAETEVERQKVSSYFVRGSEAVEFIKRIEVLGRQSSLSLALQSVSVADMDKVFRLEAKTAGRFEDTMYFLALLESLPYKVSLTGASIIKEKEEVVGEGMSQSRWAGSFTIVLESFVK